MLFEEGEGGNGSRINKSRTLRKGASLVGFWRLQGKREEWLWHLFLSGECVDRLFFPQT